MSWRKKLCIKIHLVDRLFFSNHHIVEAFQSLLYIYDNSTILSGMMMPKWLELNWSDSHNLFYDYFSLFTNNNKSLYLKPLRRLWFCWHIWSFSVRLLMSLLNAGYYSSSHTAFSPFCPAFLFIIALIIQIWMAEKFCSPPTMRQFQLGSAPIQRHRDSARMVTGKWTSHSKIDFVKCERWHWKKWKIN